MLVKGNFLGFRTIFFFFSYKMASMSRLESFSTIMLGSCFSLIPYFLILSISLRSMSPKVNKLFCSSSPRTMLCTSFLSTYFFSRSCILPALMVPDLINFFIFLGEAPSSC